MNKKTIIALTGALSIIMGFSAYAADHETKVRYLGNGNEEYTLTVPAVLTPKNADKSMNEVDDGFNGNQSGTVKLTGTWDSKTTASVNSSNQVHLVNSIDQSVTKNLDVSFDGITLSGDNEYEVSESADISVEDISDALFGKWEGTIEYTISFVHAN